MYGANLIEKKKTALGAGALLVVFVTHIPHEDFNEVPETEDDMSQKASIFSGLEELIEREG